MNDQSTLRHFAAATQSLPPHPCSELRRLGLAAADAGEALSAAAAEPYDGTADPEWDRIEDAALEARQALLNHLLFEHGITKAEAERIGGVL